MKTKTNTRVLSFLLAVATLMVSCVKDDDFAIPTVEFEEPDVEVNTSIADVKAFYQGGDPALISSGGDANTSEPMYLEAYVVSNDEAGNFYKTLVIQDKPENPTAGISVSTEVTNLYTFYEPGRKVYIRVDGLYSGEFNGLPTLGTLVGGSVGRMSIQEFDARVLRSNTVEELVPNVRTIENASEADLNTLVVFEDLQVSDADLGEPYAYIDGDAGANRVFVNCELTHSIILRTSGFANFKNLTIPSGNGSLTAVYSTFGSDVQLMIRDTDDVALDGERCSDEYEVVIVSMPFFEDFEAYQSGVGNTVNIHGWSNVNVNGGSTRYEVREFGGNKYAQTSAFNSGENPLEVWLVTPGVNLSGAKSPVLSFDTNDGFNNGTALQVLVTTDYNGVPEETSWTPLSATISSGNTNGYGSGFTPSGEVDLSAYIGQNVFIGFRYYGGNGGITTTMQIDNVSIDEGDGTGPDPDPTFGVPFTEDFEGIANTGAGEFINLPGWTNQNANGGSRRYEARSFDGNQYAQITAFNSGENPCEAWLVTPGIDLAGTAAPTLSFDTKDGFNNGDPLKVYVSTDFSGNVSTASWTELSATFATGTASGYADNFTDSGAIDLSAYTGQTVYIGFEYIGGDGGITTTMQIDNVSITD